MRSYAQKAIEEMSKKDARTVTATISNRLYIQVKSLAEREECAVSDVVRAALTIFIRQLNEDEGKTK